MGIIPADLSSDRTTAVERFELARVCMLLDALGPVAKGERVLNASRPGEIATAIGRELGGTVEASRAALAGFPDGHFDAMIDVELDAVDLFDHFAGVARLLRPRGRLVFTAWCGSDGRRGDDRRPARPTHPRARYFGALASNGFVPDLVADITGQVASSLRMRSASLLLVAAERFDSPPHLSVRRRRPPDRQRRSASSVQMSSET